MVTNTAIIFKDTFASENSYLTPREIASLISQALQCLNNVTYYCTVDNKRARDESIRQVQHILQHLHDAIEPDPENPGAENLRKLFQFMQYSLDMVRKTNNVQAANEASNLLAPLRDAFAAM